MNIVNGAKFISGNEYLNESINRCKEESEILVLFNDTVKEDPNSGVRKRAYIKVDFNLNDDSICLSKDQTYFQDASSNNLDGGTRRTFTAIHPQFLETDFFNYLIKKNKEYIEKYCKISGTIKTTLGIHFVRYEACPETISYSSPVWLHVDNEPLVFVHLLQVTSNAIGGDNIIANDDNNLTGIVRLEKFMDTIILDRTVKHAVTPFGSKQGKAYREIILFTLEDSVQNKVSISKNAE